MGEAREESPVVTLEHATVRYAGATTAALDDVSLIARAGEITALLGGNGAGKSTLLKVIAGLLEPHPGRLTLAGLDVAALERRQIARLVALVPQTERVAEGFCVREVVAMGLAPHIEGWMRPRREDEAAVDDAMTHCDLAHLAGRDVATLSGGEYRRVSIARALAQLFRPSPGGLRPSPGGLRPSPGGLRPSPGGLRPSPGARRVLALDEPAAFLDIKHRLALRDVLADVTKRDGVACIAALHDLEDAARLASHVVLLRGGRVLAAGPPAEVMTRDLLANAFDVAPTSLDVPVARAPSRS